MEKIYFDNAATTAVDERVIEKMLPYFGTIYGNANSQHFFGREAQKAVDEARDKVARLIGAQPNEIYFTSGGTEADNWAIRGCAYANINKGKHIIVSAIEHHAVLQTVEELEKEGFRITRLPVDKYGKVSQNTLKNAICDDTSLVCVMFANNETGTIEPIKELAEIAKNSGAVFFTDAVQATPAISYNVKDLGVDMLSFSAHKFHGPKGIGVLYIRNGLHIQNLIYGGEQERQRRGGTTNSPLVVGLSEALSLTRENMEKNNAHIKMLRETFIKRLISEIKGTNINGGDNCLPGIVSVTFDCAEGESVINNLDLKGIAVSGGAACASGSRSASHVLIALGLDSSIAKNTVRFSFGRNNSLEEVNYCVDKLKFIIERLQKSTQLFADIPTSVKRV